MGKDRGASLACTASQCRMAYIFLLWFFLFFFFQHLISEVTERISTKLGHTFTYDCYLKQLVRTPPGVYPSPHGLGPKKRFLRQTLTKNISAMEHDINNRKETCQSTGNPLNALPQIWGTLVHRRLRTVGEFFPPPKFLHWGHYQPYHTDVV